MKKWRKTYYAAMLVWLTVGAATGQRVFFVLFFIQFFLSICALIMNFWAALSFTYLQTLSSEKTLHGQPVQLRLKIYNEQLLPYPMMKIRLAVPAINQKPELNFNLAADSHLDFDLKLECPYRGLYEVGMTIIDFIDIFGIVRLPFNMNLLPYYRMPKLLVYPQLDELVSLPLVSRDSKEFSRRRFATEDQNEPFSTVRDYRRGDSRKLIHWKATARQHKLLTRQFEQSSEKELLLVLDLNLPPWQGEDNYQVVDILCHTATAVIHFLLRQGWHIYIADNDEFASGRSVGSKDFSGLYNWLAQVEFKARHDFTSFLNQSVSRYPNIKAVLVLTTRIDNNLASYLLQKQKSGSPIFTIIAAPARSSQAESIVPHHLHQSNLPVWLIRYGQKPGDILGGDTR